MSIQTLDHIPDIEIDIEELLGEDERAHAIAFCHQHKGPEWFPVSGTIVETICKILKRINNEKDVKDICKECSTASLVGVKCYVCSQEI